MILLQLPSCPTTAQFLEQFHRQVFSNMCLTAPPIGCFFTFEARARVTSVNLEIYTISNIVSRLRAYALHKVSLLLQSKTHENATLPAKLSIFGLIIARWLLKISWAKTVLWSTLQCKKHMYSCCFPPTNGVCEMFHYNQLRGHFSVCCKPDHREK